MTEPDDYELAHEWIARRAKGVAKWVVGPPRRPDPEPTGLPVRLHSPAVWAQRTAYRIDPLLALTNRPRPVHHVTYSRLDGEITAYEATRAEWSSRGGLFLIVDRSTTATRNP